MKSKILLISTLLVAGLFIFNSCLKDDDHDYWKDKVSGKMYATVLVPTLQSKGLQPVAAPDTFSFMINIATDKLPTKDITVTMAVNPDAITAYNTLKGTTFQLFPNIEILTPTVTIAKGTRTAMIYVKVWGADKLDACSFFMAPIGISSVSDNIPIAGNMSTYMMSLPIANPYAADYDVVGYRIRPGNPTEPIAAGTVEKLSTVDCKTVSKVGFGNYTAYNVSIEVTSDVIVVGGDNCLKVKATPYDPTTGLSVGGMWDAWHGDAAVNPPQPANPNEINYYNPHPAGGGKPYFMLNCYYNSSAGNRIMWEKLTRK